MRCVEHYRSIGLCPLPSRMDVKGPMLQSYAEHYAGTPVPESVYADWGTTNVQIVTGTRSPTASKILVVDCDGCHAIEVWREICRRKNLSFNGLWTATTGSGGFHCYFSLPPSVTSCPSGLIWGVWDTWGAIDGKGTGGWAKHREVRILADNALVIAPPSIHVETGERYSFDSRANPNRTLLPAYAPQWLLDAPRLTTPHFQALDPPPKVVRTPRPPRTSDIRYTREEVLDAIGENKLAEAIGWGLKVKSQTPNPSGWVCCFMPREDPHRSNPSGSFHYRDGTLQDRKDLSTISLFDLGALIGGYADWAECRDSLGDRYIGKRIFTNS